MSFANFVRAGGAGLWLLGACASREVPSSYPKSSPASVEAPEGAPAQVTRALEGDPPLPGAAQGGWSGLDGGTQSHGEGASPGHAHHGSHQGSHQGSGAVTGHGGHHHGH
jgi:hypothetical protein